MAMGALLILGALSWYVYSDTVKPGSQLPPTEQNPSQVEDNFPNIERISVEEARIAYDQNRAVFLDVRYTDEYEQGHIPGAVLIPLLDLPGRVVELNKDDWIITY